MPRRHRFPASALIGAAILLGLVLVLLAARQCGDGDGRPGDPAAATAPGGASTATSPAADPDAPTTDTAPPPAGIATTFTLPYGVAGTTASGVEVFGQDLGVGLRTAYDNCTAPPDSCWQLTGGAIASESPGGELVLDTGAGTVAGAIEERWSCAGTCTFDTRDLTLLIDLSATLGDPVDDGTLGPPPRPITGEATIEVAATLEQDAPSSVCGDAPCRSVRRLVATVPVTGALRGDVVRVTVERPPEQDGVPRVEDWSVLSSTSWRLPVEPFPG